MDLVCMEAENQRGMLIYPCAKGFFFVEFDIVLDWDQIHNSSLWFYHLGQLWSMHEGHLDSIFVRTTDSFSMAPIWASLPNLPLHVWGCNSLSGISSALDQYHFRSEAKEHRYITTYAHIYVNMDFKQRVSGKT